MQINFGMSWFKREDSLDRFPSDVRRLKKFSLKERKGILRQLENMFLEKRCLCILLLLFFS